jgi:ABC-type sulfate/molybdate transport systems ATPase subunit
MSDLLEDILGLHGTRFSLAARDITLAYEKRLGDGFFSLYLDDYAAQGGEIRCIYGTNGCGKTTLLRCLAGIVQPHHGSIHWSPESGPSPGDDLVLVTQAGPMPHWTVMQNLVKPLLAHGANRHEALQRSESLLRLLGLEGLGDRYAHQLSAGQQQRTILGRALALCPGILLLDEIMSGQSEYWSARIGEILRAFTRCGGMVVMVCHDPEWVSTYSDHVLNIVSGEDDAISTTRFFPGYNGLTEGWLRYREQRFSSARS